MAFMDVRVEINGNDVSQYVVSYNREHKVCTGIGTLNMEVTYEMTNDLIPWDEIDIYENGDHVGKYFVSTVTDNQPAATITIDAQDNSKRLSDYFIAETYLIDYVSYARYWIELFLNQVGVNYTFLVSGDGSIMSNNTSLGLMTAYEQIQTLLQMSGWYITFDENGDAVIGKLAADLSSKSAKFGKDDIIEFRIISSDKMYRNRALVWGAGDPTTGQWVFADVRRPGRWDYDSKDLRTVVVANSNIPNVESATLLANQIITEFAQLNVEKDLTVAGAYNLSVGATVAVRLPIWTGSGFVTTFGTSMSRNGLTTHLILDERCPRLFNFFTIGGYVYVGNYGSGVWRHHYDPLGPSWEDYSSGISPSVTDLHINNGVLVGVGAEGGAYYNIENELPWSVFSIGELPFVVSGAAGASGLMNASISGVVSSGLMTRACILDRLTNRVKFAIDTRSGYNLGDYLMETDPMTLSGAFSILSGFANAGSGLRSWIVDGNAYDGSVGTVYPIHVSGEYSCAVFDIENDSFTDYVSVGVLASGITIPSQSGLYDFGFRTNSVQGLGDSSGPYGVADNRVAVAFSPSDSFLSPLVRTNGSTQNKSIQNLMSIFNNTIVADRDIVYLESATNKVRRIRVAFADPGPGLTSSSVVSPSTVGMNRGAYLIKKHAKDVYDIYGLNFDTSLKVRKVRWDVVANTMTTTDIGENTDLWNDVQVITVGNIMYVATLRETHISFDDNRMIVRLFTANTEDDSVSTSTVLFDTDDMLDILPPDTQRHRFSKIGAQAMAMAGYMGGAQLLFHYLLTFDNDQNTFPPQVDKDYYQHVRLFHYTTTGYQTEGALNIANRHINLFTGTTGGLYGQINNGHSGSINIKPLNDDRAMVTFMLISNEGTIDHQYKIIATTGFNQRIILDETTVPFEIDTANVGSFGLTDHKGILPLFGGFDGRYLAWNPADSKYYECMSTTLDKGQVQDFPADFTVYGPFSNRDSVNLDVYWLSYQTSTASSRIIGTPLSSPGSINKNFYCPMSASYSTIYGLNAGNFFIQDNGAWVYYDNVNPPAPRAIRYYILQRNNQDYNILYSGLYQQRIDISKFTQLVAMDRRLSSTQVYTILASGVTISGNVALSGVNLSGVGGSGLAFDLGITVDDYRYSDFEWMPGHVMERDLFAAYNGDLGIMNLADMSTFSGTFISPSGHITKVESSNYSLPEQHTFLATSGDMGGFGFFYKDPSGLAYISLLETFPQVRPTIIRLDDKL